MNRGAPIGNQLHFALYDCYGPRQFGTQRRSLRISGKSLSREIPRPSVLFEGRTPDGQSTLGPTLPGPYAPHEFPVISREVQITRTSSGLIPPGLLANRGFRTASNPTWEKAVAELFLLRGNVKGGCALGERCTIPVVRGQEEIALHDDTRDTTDARSDEELLSA